METPNLSVRSLHSLNNAFRQKLGTFLWSWDLCDICTDQPSCTNRQCHWSRSDQLDVFWSQVDAMIRTYEPDRNGRIPALISLDDLFTLMQTIRDNRDMTKVELLQKIYKQAGLTSPKDSPTPIDQDRAFRIASSILLTIDQGILRDYANLAEGNVPDCPWRDNISLNNFIQEAFPTQDDRLVLERVKPKLLAQRLDSRNGLQLVPTNDLRRHLMLDDDNKAVYIFQQHAALIEMLHTSTLEPNSGSPTSLAENATIYPRQLILETLDTIHELLFPQHSDSHKFRRRLLKKMGFEKFMLHWTDIQYRTDDDPVVKFEYFHDRLQALSRLPHRGWIAWTFETKALWLQAYGFGLATLFSVLAVVLAILQCWIAYQAWSSQEEELAKSILSQLCTVSIIKLC